MRNFIPAAMAAALVGCGGGSGGSSSGPGPADLQAAPLPAQAASPAFPAVNLTATDGNGNTFAMATAEIVEIGVALSFGGQDYSYNYDSVVIVDQNNIAQLIASSDDFYQPSPYMPVGSEVPLGSTGIINSTMFSEYYDLLTSWTPPASLTVGASGQLDSVTYYNNTGTLIGTGTVTYAVVAYSPAAVEYQLTTEALVNGIRTSMIESYTVTASGAVALLSVTLTLQSGIYAGETLTFT
jgi:hypothetical protein